MSVTPYSGVSNLTEYPFWGANIINLTLYMSKFGWFLTGTTVALEKVDSQNTVSIIYLLTKRAI